MTAPWSARYGILIGWAALTVLVLGVGAWAATTRIAGAIIASGTIVVQNNRQVVQHPEGGVVSAILARNGDLVAAGDVILRFQGQHLRSELAIVEAQLFETLARIARLEAERDDIDIAFPPLLDDLAVNSAEARDQMTGQARLFQARRASLEHEAAQLQEQSSQIENQIDGTLAQRAALNAQRTLITSEITDQRSLLDRGLTPSNRLSALQREDARLRGEIGRVSAIIAQLRSELASLALQDISLRTQRREEAITQLRDLQIHQFELTERRVALQDRLAQGEIRSPVSGRILDSQVFGVGAVVQPAAPILYVVPEGHPLLVIARIEPRDIDQVHLGQMATLHFTTLDQRRGPEVLGTIINLSADALTDPVSGRPYFEAEITPHITDATRRVVEMLHPGMPAIAFVTTGERTPLAYLTQPVSDYFAKAFRE
ncbi:MAG: HlyD family type I secretion periplasmic adaptor subunit [Pseudomonadota bacterium]